MEKIYVDSLNHCHRTDDGTMTAVETDFFVGKCDAFVEGYACGSSNGCVHIYPWKPYSGLDAAQRAYEKERLADAEGALAILLGGDSE